MKKSDQLVHSLLVTRSLVIDILMKNGHKLTFDDRRALEWDLWLVHGILEVGYSSNDLQQLK